MSENNRFKEESLLLIREVSKDPSINQRLLSKRLDISLGKTNYLLKELAKKGFVKIHNFSKNPKKSKTVRYMLTKKGIDERVNLTRHFLKVKESEFERLKEEYASYISTTAQG